MRSVDLHTLKLDLGHGHAHVSFSSDTVNGQAVRELYELAMSFDREDHARLLIDTTGVTLVPSGALGMLVTIRKKFLASGGQLHIAVPDPRVMEQFELLYLHRVLSIFPSVEEAADAFK